MLLNIDAEYISNLIILAIVIGIPVFGAWRKVNVYDSFIEGAKEGFEVAVNIAPYLVGMLVAIGMLRASGAIDSLADLFHPILAFFGLPDDVAFDFLVLCQGVPQMQYWLTLLRKTVVMLGYLI